MKKTIMLITVFAIAACGKSGDQNEAGVQSAAADTEPEAALLVFGSYTDALREAERLIAEAADRGHAWTTSEILLERAKETEGSGDVASAQKLAMEAAEMAKLSIAQADYEEKTWRDRAVGE